MLAKKHQGFSFTVFVIVLFLLCVDAYVAIKLIPAYWDNHIFKKSLSDLNDVINDSDNPHLFSRQQILRHLHKKLSMQNVRDVPFRKLKLERVADGYEASLAYDITEPLFWNISAKLHFDDTADLIYENE